MTGSGQTFLVATKTKRAAVLSRRPDHRARWTQGLLSDAAPHAALPAGATLHGPPDDATGAENAFCEPRQARDRQPLYTKTNHFTKTGSGQTATLYKNDHFTKTGPGQTDGNLKTRTPYSAG